MTTQSYRVLYPVLNSGTLSNQGDLLSLDDADPETTSLIAEGQIILASDPSAASMLTADEANTTAQSKGPGEAQTPQGEFD